MFGLHKIRSEFQPQEFRITYVPTSKTAVISLQGKLRACAERKESSQHTQEKLLRFLRDTLAYKGIYISPSATLADMYIVRCPTLRDTISPQDVSQAKQRRNKQKTQKRKFTL